MQLLQESNVKRTLTFYSPLLKFEAKRQHKGLQLQHKMAPNLLLGLLQEARNSREHVSLNMQYWRALGCGWLKRIPMTTLLRLCRREANGRRRMPWHFFSFQLEAKRRACRSLPSPYEHTMFLKSLDLFVPDFKIFSFQVQFQMPG